MYLVCKKLGCHLLKQQQPKIRILVNAAGFGLIGKFTELNIDRQLEMVDVNCKALAKLTHLSLPYMKRNIRIINLSSSASFAPQPDFAIYAALYEVVFAKFSSKKYEKYRKYFDLAAKGKMKFSDLLISIAFSSRGEVNNVLQLRKKLM